MPALTVAGEGSAFELKADPRDVDEAFIKDAYAEIRPGAMRFGLDKLKLPGSREYGKRQRSLWTFSNGRFGRVLAAQRDLGVAVHADLGRNSTTRWASSPATTTGHPVEPE